MNGEVPDLPEQKSRRRQAAEVAAEGVVGAMPFVGSLLAVTLATTFSAVQESRTRAWMEEMADVVEALMARVEGLEAQDLAESTAFYDTAVAAARIATASSSQDKHRALQNALFNVGSSSAIEDDKRVIFLRYVDELTPSHVRFLRFLNSPVGWFEDHDLDWPSFYTAGLMSVVTVAFPEWERDEELLDVIASDLVARGLADNPGLRTMMTANGLTAQRTKMQGRQFLEFISGPFDGP